jgi:hypothetical protein
MWINGLDSSIVSLASVAIITGNVVGRFALSLIHTVALARLETTSNSYNRFERFDVGQRPTGQNEPLEMVTGIQAGYDTGLREPM